MISLTCTKCQAVLTIDVAFAGGVCRCEHCGTIQTVPAHLKSKSSSSGKKTGRTLYSKSRRDEALPSSGLEQIAQVVASSGLSSGLLNRPLGKRAKRRRTLMLVSIGLAMVAVFVGGMWLASRGAGPSASMPAPGPAMAMAESSVALRPITTPAPSAPAQPSFCGLPLPDKSVIYVLDRGSGTGDLFSYLKEAAFRSAESLGEQREFQFVFWNNGSDDAFPPNIPTRASAQNVEAARKALDGIYAHGQSDATSALVKAVAAGPQVIVLATGKGGQLTDDFVKQVMQIRGSKSIKIHTFDLGGTELCATMKAIASQTGGEARLISEGELKKFARE